MDLAERLSEAVGFDIPKDAIPRELSVEDTSSFLKGELEKGKKVVPFDAPGLFLLSLNRAVWPFVWSYITSTAQARWDWGKRHAEALLFAWSHLPPEGWEFFQRLKDAPVSIALKTTLLTNYLKGLFAEGMSLPLKEEITELEAKHPELAAQSYEWILRYADKFFSALCLETPSQGDPLLLNLGENSFLSLPVRVRLERVSSHPLWKLGLCVPQKDGASVIQAVFPRWKRDTQLSDEVLVLSPNLLEMTVGDVENPENNEIVLVSGLEKFYKQPAFLFSRDGKLLGGGYPLSFYTGRAEFAGPAAIEALLQEAKEKAGKS